MKRWDGRGADCLDGREGNGCILSEGIWRECTRLSEEAGDNGVMGFWRDTSCRFNASRDRRRGEASRGRKGIKVNRQREKMGVVAGHMMDV